MNRISLITLGVTALVIGRATLLLVQDPEGPNLLIVVGFALFLYLVSLPVYVLASVREPLKVIIAITLQLVVAAGIFLLFSA